MAAERREAQEALLADEEALAQYARVELPRLLETIEKLLA